MKNTATLSLESNVKLRPLISYALSSYSMAHGDDYFKALVPLFAPIIAKNPGTLFEPKTFCVELQKNYGLHINEHVANNFIDPMMQAGLLEKTTEGKRHVAYRYALKLSENLENDYQKFEEKLGTVFEKYHAFVAHMEALTKDLYQKDELEDGLIDWILRSDQRLGLSNEYKKEPKSELDFIASRFLQNLEENDDALFNDLALIYSGAIISELVLDFKLPQTSKKKARDLNVFLDAPFVMHLLNLSGRQSHESANSIFKQLQSLEAQLYIFDHSCEEIEGNIRGVLNPANPEKRGPLAMAMAGREVMPDYVTTVRNNLNKHIESLGIKVFSPSSFGSEHQRERFFANEIKDRLYDAIAWPNPIARERDVCSISTIMRWRGRTKDRDYIKSRYLFVTNNRSLAAKTRKFCLDEGLIKQTHAPPAISVQTLSGILFLMLGDAKEKLSLSRKQLLASCGRAAIANPGIIEAFSDKLKELSPENAEQVTAILSEPRTVQLAMDMTWGNVDAITRDNVEDVFENLKEDIAAEQTAKHKKKIKIVSEERDLIANDNTLLRTEQKHAVSKIVYKAVKNINRALRCVKLLIVCLSIAALWAAAFGGEPESFTSKSIFLAAGLFGLVINFYPFWVSPQWFSKKIVRQKKCYAEKKLQEIGLKDRLSDYSVDWGSGKISDIKDDLFGNLKPRA